MKSFYLGLAAAALCATTTDTASAQWFRNQNVISNSGNGAGNVIQAVNQGGGGFAPQGPVGYPGGYGGGYGQPVGYGGGYGQPAGYGGYAQPGLPIGGGRLINRIANSGNGVGNTIAAQNVGGGYGYPGGYSPFGQGGFGVNVNVIANSANGVGNVVQGLNRSNGRNGLNLNFVTNSGNGAYNQIGAFNR